MKESSNFMNIPVISEDTRKMEIHKIVRMGILTNEEHALIPVSYTHLRANETTAQIE